MTSEGAAEGGLLRTTVVGSYPQPDWLVDKELLKSQPVPRVRIEALWRVQDGSRGDALQRAALDAIRDMEAAGIDAITDGEIAREGYGTRFVSAVTGLDEVTPAVITFPNGRTTKVPRVVGPVRHQRFVEVDAARFLREHTRRRAKVTLPGPFTLAQQSKDEFYNDPAALATDFAIALNEEAKALEKTGIDVIQLDEPWIRMNPEGARRYGVSVLNRALEGLTVRTAVHMCFGYAFMRPGLRSGRYEFLAELADARADEISIEAAQPDLDLSVLKELSGKAIALGVLDHSTREAESVDVVVRRIRAGLKYIAPDKLLPAPDCGMKYMTREVAFQRLCNLAQAAQIVRRELTGQTG